MKDFCGSVLWVIIQSNLLVASIVTCLLIAQKVLSRLMIVRESRYAS